MSNDRAVPALPVVVAVAVVILASCIDQFSPVGLVSEDRSPDRDRFGSWVVHPRGLPPLGVRSQHGATRSDAPYWGWSDQELADNITRTGGRVVIGFRDPGTQAGVDDWGRVLVSHGSARAGIAYLEDTLGLKVDRLVDHLPMVRTYIDPEIGPDLRRHPLIDYVEPSRPISLLAQDDTTWNVKHVSAPQAWLSGGSGSGVGLLIIDSGISSSHPDLYVHGHHGGCSGGTGTEDVFGHGTRVAGIAGALANNEYILGVAPSVKLYSAKIPGSDPDLFDVVCALGWAHNNRDKVFVVNMSLGVIDEPYSGPSINIADAVATAFWQDSLFLVAAAGNGGPVRYPAKYADVVAVSGVDSLNNRSSSLSYGPEVELVAPGVEVITTNIPESPGACYSAGYTVVCGATSLAAPHVSAAATILKSVRPSWTNVQIRERLQNSAIPVGHPDTVGYGVLDIDAAIPRKLTLNVSGGGKIDSSIGGTICESSESQCVVDFYRDDTDTLTAVPNESMHFVGWSGACSAQGPCILSMDTDRTATATFTPITDKTLTVQRAPGFASRGGVVKSTPGGIDCTVGYPDTGTCEWDFAATDTVQLSVVATYGTFFDEWSGDCSGSPCILSMAEARTVTPVFECQLFGTVYYAYDRYEIDLVDHVNTCYGGTYYGPIANVYWSMSGDVGSPAYCSGSAAQCTVGQIVGQCDPDASLSVGFYTSSWTLVSSYVLSEEIYQPECS